ncbi:hypothetical protein QUF70_07515 [Desulfobacterales bacterium HSG17]|nr:hypothetical protein [Desulfobacterales bacterium HSG17]
MRSEITIPFGIIESFGLGLLATKTPIALSFKAYPDAFSFLSNNGDDMSQQPGLFDSVDPATIIAETFLSSN